MVFTPNEEKYIRWYDWLWLMIPIAGIVVMVASVAERAERARHDKTQNV